jgi:hypothetical protein
MYRGGYTEDEEEFLDAMDAEEDVYGFEIGDVADLRAQKAPRKPRHATPPGHSAAGRGAGSRPGRGRGVPSPQSALTGSSGADFSIDDDEASLGGEPGVGGWGTEPRASDRVAGLMARIGQGGVAAQRYVRSG